MTHSTPLTVVQILPALNAGGVERGTMEFARELKARGHRSIVISSGGTLVDQLEAEGSVHIQLPVHRKSPRTLLQIAPLRATLQELKPDIVHVRSRMPAWINWLALRALPEQQRPVLISTVHGMYSVNAYSAIMTKADHIIAISDCVLDYITSNYHIDRARITRIYRGLDPSIFNHRHIDEQWLRALVSEYPQLHGKRIILMPGRLSRWKGQEAFLDVMKHICASRSDVHGVVIGGAEPNKQHYLQELLARRDKLGLKEQVSFMGHRKDIHSFYSFADVTCHLSNKAEPFGRTVPEALACGCPVVAFDRGGASESLHRAFPQGLIEPDNSMAFADRILEILDSPPQDIQLPEEFFLQQQVKQTLNVYYNALANKTDAEL